MRTGYSTLQQQHYRPLSAVFTRNPRTILIGVLAKGEQATDHARRDIPLWGQVLEQSVKGEWLLPEWTDIEAENSTLIHPLFDWHDLNTGETRVGMGSTSARPGVYDALKGGDATQL